MTLDCKADDGREQIVFGRTIDWDDEASGGMVRIGELGPDLAGPDPKYLSRDQLARLIQEGYVDPEGTQNSSPTMQVFLDIGDELADEYGVTVGYQGYMISPERRDVRVTVTSITIVPGNEQDIIPREAERRFNEAFRSADDSHIEDTGMWAWWD